VLQLMVSSVYAAVDQNPYPMVLGLVDEARELRLSGKFFEAEGKLIRAQRVAPRSADVYLELAHLRKDQGDYSGLKDVIEVGVDLADGPPSSLTQLQLLKNKLAVLLPLDPNTPIVIPPGKSSTQHLGSATANKKERPMVGLRDDLTDKKEEEITSSSSRVSRDRAQAVSFKESTTEKNTLNKQNPKNKSSNGAQTESKKSIETLSEVGKTGSSERDQLDRSGAQKSESQKPSKIPAPKEKPSVLVESDDIKRGRAKPSEIQKTNVYESSKDNGPRSAEATSAASTAAAPIQSQTPVKTDSQKTSDVSEKSFNRFFTGVGILAKPQTGVWISRGILEKDF